MSEIVRQKVVVNSVPDSEKHVNLSSLYIIKDYVKRKIREAGGTIGDNNAITEDDLATDQEVKDLFSD